MALYGFDGTWNAANDDEDPHSKNTNVFLNEALFDLRPLHPFSD